MGAAERLNKSFYSIEEYWKIDGDNQEERYEYIEGQLRAMSGGSAYHSLISSNINRRLSEGTDGKNCFVFNSDLKVEALSNQRYFYPDVSIVCGEIGFAENRKDIITNPSLIVEVLSDATEAYDRGEKFMWYRQIPSLKAYLLVSQYYPHIDAFFKNAQGVWQLSEKHGLNAVLDIEPLNSSLKLSEVYAMVEFE